MCYTVSTNFSQWYPSAARSGIAVWRRQEVCKVTSLRKERFQFWMPQPKLIWLMSHIDGNPLQPPAEISPSSQEWVGRTDVYFLILLTNFSGRVSPVTLDFMLTLSPQSCSGLDLFQLRRIVVVVVSANFFWSSESCHARHQINSFTSVLFSSGWLMLVRLVLRRIVVVVWASVLQLKTLGVTR